MSAILHFDTEFSHPCPRLGSLLHIGMVVHPFNEETLECSGPTHVHQAYFKVAESSAVTDWVRENQKELLERCQNISYIEDTQAKQSVIDFLVEMKKKYEKIIPAGYVIGSDIAYLYDLLGKDIELVHYAAIDIKSLGIFLQRTFEIHDEDLARQLEVDENTDEHNALFDAFYQAKLLISCLKKIRLNAGI